MTTLNVHLSVLQVQGWQVRSHTLTTARPIFGELLLRFPFCVTEDTSGETETVRCRNAF